MPSSALALQSPFLLAEAETPSITRATTGSSGEQRSLAVVTEIELNSPMSALATDLEMNLGRPKTPRRCLTSLLVDAQARKAPQDADHLSTESDNDDLCLPTQSPSADGGRRISSMCTSKRSTFRDSGICLSDNASVILCSDDDHGGECDGSPSSATRITDVRTMNKLTTEANSNVSTAHWSKQPKNHLVPFAKPPRPIFHRQSTEPTVIQRKRQLLSSASPTLLAGYDAVLHNSPMEIDSLDDYESSGAGSLRPMKIRRTQSCSSSQPPVERGNSQAVNAHIYGHEACLLPWFPGESDSHKRINGQTLVNLLDGHYRDTIDEFYIIDCRFPYEYEGGHIDTARNINTKNELDNLFFKSPISHKKLVIIFHCEFSSHRAPRMATYMRTQDRLLNMERYPNLTYPEIYVLKGGYKNFYAEFKDRCFPQRYVEMVDRTYLKDLKKSKAIHKREFGRSISESYVGQNR